jgi:alkylhydroperoxidase/carboxymuconolactone decarboxylase family protein YurZ
MMSSTNMAPEQVFHRAADESLPVLETIFRMHLDTLQHCSLDPRSYHLVRIAALIAIDAPPASYLTHLAVAADDGVTAEDVQGVAVAIARLVGSPRITAAAAQGSRVGGSPGRERRGLNLDGRRDVQGHGRSDTHLGGDPARSDGIQ